MYYVSSYQNKDTKEIMLNGVSYFVNKLASNLTIFDSRYRPQTSNSGII